ncbi:hypothetical protein D3OALGA1CA_1324 [Olavius algarvensis associated proteobacterium Delta 3]|nr:hypothetical protein D3OALGB2SA_606 [Olavius algarvensis associated proteobacterium Delta 3]CAB5099195.1 hypothetical protein D3OALGA1CA_1324 [Olavius algarvensis associated proteobacterium Delta 3]
MTPGEPLSLIPAATVVLVRPAGASFQVYLLQRSPGSGFMAGQYVFPGGILEAEDRAVSFWKRQVDLDIAGIEKRFGGSLRAEDALSFGVAAIRETLEEAGVLLASGNAAFDRQLEQVCRRRHSEGRISGWFNERAEKDGWVLSLSGLRRWSHWITPLGMKRRFDTRFFLARMPDGQTCVPDNRETVHGVWVTPQEGLQGNLDGDVPLSPPTVVTLHQLLAYPDDAALMTSAVERPWGEAVRPRMVKLEEGAVIIEPWDPEYDHPTISIDPTGLDSAVAPVGRSFSRIWIHRGRCRPIATA